MMSVETMNLPAPAGPDSANPELIAHEWDPNGTCLNPERVVVDFGKKGGNRQCVIELGVCEDGTWRVGWDLTPKSGRSTVQGCNRTGGDFATRVAALRVGLARAMQLFEGDRPGVQCIEALFTRTLQGGEVPPACEPSEAPEALPAAQPRPLPRGEPMDIPMAAIQRNPEQPRKDFPAVQEQELADSIASVGLLQRIIVRKLLPEELGELPGIDGQDRYEIVAGERRWRAHVRLERSTIPAEVYSGLSRREAAAAALVENLQREGLNPIEEAEGYRHLMFNEGLTQEECAKRVGVSRPVVANALRVLELPEKVVQMIREGALTLAHGTALARFKKWPLVATVIAEAAVDQKESASALEEGLPFAEDLIEAGLAAEVSSAKFDYKVPSELRKHSSAFESDYGRTYLLDVEFYKDFAKEYARKKREEQEKEAERQAKKKKPSQTLADLKNQVYEISKQQEPIVLRLIPDDITSEVARSQWDKTKVTVCEKPDFAKKIQEEVEKLIQADRAARLPTLIERARTKISALKKVGPREIGFLLVASICDERDGGLTREAAKRIGTKLPEKLCDLHYCRMDAEKLDLAAKGDILSLVKVRLISWLDSVLPEDYVRHFIPSEPWAEIVRWLLELEDFGLLEETKVGQKQLVDTVKAQEWYQRDLAAAEGREYVPQPSGPASAGKAAKKGGRK